MHINKLISNEQIILNNQIRAVEKFSHLREFRYLKGILLHYYEENEIGIPRQLLRFSDEYTINLLSNTFTVHNIKITAPEFRNAFKPQNFISFHFTEYTVEGIQTFLLFHPFSKACIEDIPETRYAPRTNISLNIQINANAWYKVLNTYENFMCCYGCGHQLYKWSV